MVRRFVSVAAVFFFVAGLALSGEYTGMISEHKDGKITISYKKDFKDKDEEPTKKTFKVSKDVKITKKGFGKDAEETTVKAEDFASEIEKAGKGKGDKGKGKGKGRMGGGLFAKVTTEGEGDAETVTKIAITSFGGGKGGKKKKEDK